MTIDPRIAFWFGVWTSILLLVASGGISFDGALPAAYVPMITKWCAILGATNSTILTAANGYSSNRPGPLVNVPASATMTVVRVLLVAFALSFLVAGGSAMAQTRLQPKPIDLVQKMKDDFTAKTGVTATGDLANDLVKALDAKLLPDLQYALKLALATKSNVTAPCWQAWIDMINTQQTAVKNADGTEIPAPDPHLVTSFERMVELRNALQPESDFMIKCSPVASMVKKDITGFMGVVISGGAGIATLVPGL